MAERAGSIIGAIRGGHKAQASVDSYTNWVIDSLIGYKGRNRNDVVSTIIREWLNDHRVELEAVGIPLPRIRTGEVAIIPPGA
jgi:hypothetical protein